MADPNRKKKLASFLKGIRDKPRSESFRDTLKELAESSSLHGIPKIVSSRQVAIKVLWCLLLLATFSVLAYQLVNLFKAYYSYPIQTSVSLQFNSIPFPAISICNMNPVRKSKLGQSQTLAQLLNVMPGEESRRKRRAVRRKRRAALENPSHNDYSDTSEPDIRKEPTASGITELEKQNYNKVLKKEVKFAEAANVQRQLPDIHSKLSNYVEDYEVSDDADGKSGKEETTLIRPTGVVKDDDLFRNGKNILKLRRRERAAGNSSVVDSSTNISSSMSPSSSYNSPSSSSYYYGSSTNISSSMSSSSSYNSPSSSSYYYGSTDYYDYWNNNFYNNHNSDYNDWENYIDNIRTKKDSWEQRIEDVKSMFRNMTLPLRQQIGHQREDLFLTATFAGLTQTNQRMSQFSSNDYGNCYTLAAKQYKAWRSGPSYGFKLTLNLEIDEYIGNFTTGYGARVVFHEPNTQPMPSKDGITLSPGTETNIGLKTVQISRLGPPYGHCENGKDFANEFRLKYSLTACYEFCQMKVIIDECSCLPPGVPDKISLNTTFIPICNSSTESEDVDHRIYVSVLIECTSKIMGRPTPARTASFVCRVLDCDHRCVFQVHSQFNKGTYVCDCREPCKEFVYTKTMSSTYWPTHNYLGILLDEVCKEKNNTEQWKAVCNNFDDLSYEDLEKYKNNFVRVLIYFEDLNYEQITEEPLYEGVRFLSDIGGAMGLFMGASVLSMVEVAQVILEIILYARNRWSQKQKTRVTAISPNN